MTRIRQDGVLLTFDNLDELFIPIKYIIDLDVISDSTSYSLIHKMTRDHKFFILAVKKSILNDKEVLSSFYHYGFAKEDNKEDLLIRIPHITSLDYKIGTQEDSFYPFYVEEDDCWYGPNQWQINEIEDEVICIAVLEKDRNLHKELYKDFKLYAQSVVRDEEIQKELDAIGESNII